jgi:ammonium transporter, Amt family
LTPQQAPILSESAAVVCFIAVLLVPLAGAGLALINTGLGRSRSAAHLMLSSLCAVSVAALVYVVFGFAWQGYFGSPGYQFIAAGRGWNWIAAEPLFLRGIQLDGSSTSLAALLGVVSVALTALIPLGAGADRWRLGAICISTALLAGWIYPLFAHWVWGGGWLSQLGANAGLGRGFVDVGGSASIQAVGGLTALSMAWILGPRRGKYTWEGMPSAIPGHNSVLVLFGCLLALLGWSGLNTAGTLLFTGVEPGRAVRVVVNTALSAAASFLTAVIITRIRFGKPDASLSANGWVGGLAASSAGCAFAAPPAAVAIGIVAGALVIFSVEWFELQLGVDDPGGVISAHALGGIWGVLSVGIFANLTALGPSRSGKLSSGSALGDPGQWLAQLVGIATLIGFVLPLSYGLNWLLNRFYPQRVAAEGESQGMDLYELGAGAYPDFLTHSDEFTQR